MKTLLHLSGGLDSVYTAYDWLRNNPGKTLLLHHVNLHHKKEDRLDLEQKAVADTLNYFRGNGLTNFEYIESSFLYGDLTAFIKDFYVVAVFTAIILKQYKQINTILVSNHKGETNITPERRYQMAMSIYRPLGVEREVIFKFPNIGNTRKDMFEKTPPELYRIAKSCRVPVDGAPCGKCSTCKQFVKLSLEPI